MNGRLWFAEKASTNSFLEEVRFLQPDASEYARLNDVQTVIEGDFKNRFPKGGNWVESEGVICMCVTVAGEECVDWVTIINRTCLEEVRPDVRHLCSKMRPANVLN